MFWYMYRVYMLYICQLDQSYVLAIQSPVVSFKLEIRQCTYTYLAAIRWVIFSFFLRKKQPSCCIVCIHNKYGFCLWFPSCTVESLSTGLYKICVKKNATTKTDTKQAGHFLVDRSWKYSRKQKTTFNISMTPLHSSYVLNTKEGLLEYSRLIIYLPPFLFRMSYLQLTLLFCYDHRK